MALLDSHGALYRYRNYREEPLSPAELQAVLGMLGLAPADVLRTHDKAYVELGLSGQEPPALLITLMAEHPTLLQRPIGVHEGGAVIGRPPEHLLDFVKERPDRRQLDG